MKRGLALHNVFNNDLGRVRSCMQRNLSHVFRLQLHPISSDVFWTVKCGRQTTTAATTTTTMAASRMVRLSLRLLMIMDGA